MSMKLEKLIAKIARVFRRIPKPEKCRLASCWEGANASRRMMNILSPHFTDAKFRDYLAWMKARGCDTAHVFLINKGDGEGAGYNCATDSNAARTAKRRIEKIRDEGLAVVPWIIADDSADWARDLFANADERVEALRKAGLFDEASYIVLGLEMNEYGNAKDWNRVAVALRARWSGKIGVHHTSGNAFPFAGIGDIILGQLEPAKANAATIADQIRKIRALGKQAVGFEYARSPDRAKAQAALDADAIGCGNW